MKDIILAIDRTPVDGLPVLALELFTRNAGEAALLHVLRASEELDVNVTFAERPHDADRLMDFVEPDRSSISKLGILGVDLNEANARLAARACRRAWSWSATRRRRLE